MKPISFKRHRFPPDTIRLAVWLYFRFTTSLRDVEEMLAERGIDVSYGTVRCWTNKFGPAIAANIRRRRGQADSVWLLDEMVVRINGKSMFMSSAVDKEGEVLDVLVQKRRNKSAALNLLKKLLKNQGCVPDAIVTDGLAYYRAALRELGGLKCHKSGRLRDKTGPRILIFLSDDENGKCNASSLKIMLNGSFQPTPQSTTPSTSSAT